MEYAITTYAITTMDHKTTTKQNTTKPCTCSMRHTLFSGYVNEANTNIVDVCANSCLSVPGDEMSAISNCSSDTSDCFHGTADELDPPISNNDNIPSTSLDSSAHQVNPYKCCSGELACHDHTKQCDVNIQEGNIQNDKDVKTKCHLQINSHMDTIISTVDMTSSKRISSGDENGNDVRHVTPKNTLDALRGQIYQCIVKVFENKCMVCTTCSNKAVISHGYKSVQCEEEVPKSVHRATQHDNTLISVNHKAQQCEMGSPLALCVTVSCQTETPHVNEQQIENQSIMTDTQHKSGDENGTVKPGIKHSDGSDQQTGDIKCTSPAVADPRFFFTAPGQIFAEELPESISFTAEKSSKATGPQLPTPTIKESGQVKREVDTLFEEEIRRDLNLMRSKGVSHARRVKRTLPTHQKWKAETKQLRKMIKAARQVTPAKTTLEAAIPAKVPDPALERTSPEGDNSVTEDPGKTKSAENESNNNVNPDSDQDSVGAERLENSQMQCICGHCYWRRLLYASNKQPKDGRPGLHFADWGFLHSMFAGQVDCHHQLDTIPRLPHKNSRSRHAKDNARMVITVKYNFKERHLECLLDVTLLESLNFLRDDIPSMYCPHDPELVIVSKVNSKHYRLSPSIKMRNLRAGFPSGAAFKFTVFLYLRDLNRVIVRHW